MNRKFSWGTIGGIKLSADLTILIGLVVAFVIFMFVLNQWGHLSSSDARIVAICAAVLHFALAFLHQLGHAIAARMLGRPMKGIHFFLLMSRSIYPDDEPELTPAQHIKRALDGPLFSVLVGVIIGLVVLALRPVDSVLDYLLFILAADSIVFFCLIALTPSVFVETDGGTILKWLRHK